MNFNNKNKVTIAKDAMGNTIRVSKRNAEYSHIRITQEKTDINPSGWMQTKTISALIHGKTEDLKKSGIGRIKYLPGNIIVKEQHEPFSKSNPDRDIKRAGAGGPICRVDDQPIYRTTSYDSTGLKADLKIEHTNTAEIREESIGDQSMIKNTSTLKELNDTKSVTEDEVDPNQVDLEDMIEDVKNDNTEMNEEEAVVVTDEVEIEEEEPEEIVVEESVFSL